MDRRIVWRRLAAVVAAIAGLGTLAWLTGFIDPDPASFTIAGMSSDMAVVVPSAAFIMVVTVAGLMLVKRTPHDRPDEPYVACGTCSRSILREWRLCPYCGSHVERGTLEEGSAHRAV